MRTWRRSGPVVRVHLSALVMLSLLGCNSGGDAGTGMHISSSWSGAQVDQLEFVVTTSAGAEVHPAERRPLVAAEPLASGVDVVILVADQLASQRLRCTVNGYWRGARVRQGEAVVELVQGTVVDVAVAMLGGGPTLPDAGPERDAGTPPDVA